MKDKKWILYLFGLIAGTCIYTAYRFGTHASVFLWGSAIAIIVGLLLNHIFRLSPSQHKPAREAYAEYQERREEKKTLKRQREP